MCSSSQNKRLNRWVQGERVGGNAVGIHKASSLIETCCQPMT